MEWFGPIAFVMCMCYSGKIGKIDKLEKRLKKYQMKEKGGSKMSKLIMELVGKTCTIKMAGFDENLEQKIKCNVLDADEEWIKISYTSKKGVAKTKIMRVDEVVEVELMEETIGDVK